MCNDDKMTEWAKLTFNKLAVPKFEDSNSSQTDLLN